MKKGDLIRIYADKEYGVCVMEIKGNSIFIYSTKVNDVKAIENDYIFMMNVVVTQQLTKDIEQLKAEIRKLKKQENIVYA